MRLLIAEDDFTSRAMLAGVTKKWAYEIVEAEDGEDAWKITQQDDAPLLLLIDWEMPNLNGIELCQRIREKSTNNPPYIILLSARGQTNDVVKGLASGANDYMSKPFDNAELQARLQVGKQLLEVQEELKELRDESNRERETIEDIILKMRFSKPFESTHLRKLDLPVERTSGDIMLSAFRPDKTRHIMLGDFTGHGLTAALGGPTIYDVFYAMTAKNIPLREIIYEMNKQMLDKMPTGLFLGAVLIELNTEEQLTVWNCGMSDLLIYRHSMLWKKIPSSTLALGIIKQEFELPEPVSVKKEDRIYIYSDGITEVTSINEEEFGQFRLEQSIHQMLITDAEINSLSHTITQFQGKAKQQDDITLIEITVK